jgi:very-short-patch-repair endonuclease
MRSDPDKTAFAGRICRFEDVFGGGGDTEVLRVAKLQHGCVHRRQLVAAGIGYQGLRRRVRAARLCQLHTDVFLAWPGSSRLLERAMAAALQFRGDAVIGGCMAAAIWGIVEADPGEVELTLVGRNAKPQPGLRVRRVATLSRADSRRRLGIPLTSPARTLIDLGAVLAPVELENALAEARFRSLVRDAELTDALARAPSRAGTAALRRLLSYTQTLAAGPARTRSGYERKLLQLIDEAGLPRPATNVPVAGHVVDMFWPEQRLVVEFDGYAFHGDRRAFERDRLRDQDLVAAGYRVIRITARQLDQTPFAVIARLAQALHGPPAV